MNAVDPMSMFLCHISALDRGLFIIHGPALDRGLFIIHGPALDRGLFIIHGPAKLTNTVMTPSKLSEMLTLDQQY